MSCIVAAHRPIFMTLNKMTDADKTVNLRYFRSDPAYIPNGFK